jgi:hypothetical protein
MVSALISSTSPQLAARQKYIMQCYRASVEALEQREAVMARVASAAAASDAPDEWGAHHCLDVAAEDYADTPEGRLPRATADPSDADDPANGVPGPYRGRPLKGYTSAALWLAAEAERGKLPA